MTLAALLLFGALQQAVRDDQCIACHADDGLEVKESLHEKAGVGCVSCHGTDEVVKEKHKFLPTFRPARVHEIAAVCGACHEAVAEDFRGSAHAQLQPGNEIEAKHRSTCTACHDAHATPVAQRSKILETCLTCHEKESPEYWNAVEGFKPVDALESSLGQLNESLARARPAAGIAIGDLEAKRRDAESARLRCRNLQHGLAWDRVRKAADEGRVLATEGSALLAERERDFGKRFAGLAIFLALLGLSAGLVVYRAKRVV